MDQLEQDMTGAQADEAVNGSAGGEAGAAADDGVGAAALMEAIAQRERQRDPAAAADIEKIHQRALLAAEAASAVKGEDV